MTNRWCLSLVVALLAGLGLALLVGGFDPLSAQSTAPAYTPNQELPLPLLAGDPALPVHFVVRGLEPSITTDSQGSIYVSSIRGVPTGVDLHRYSPVTDGAPNADGTLPFVYLGRPDNCGIFATGCDFLGVAEGGGDSSLAVTDMNPATGIPDLTVTSLTLAPGVTSMGSFDRGNSFSQPNPAAALIPGDDRQWTDGIDQNTVYLTYHDVATFNIEVQRSNDGGQTYINGFGEAIDPSNFLIAGTVTGSANIAGPVKVDHSQCSSRGNVYAVYAAADNATENAMGAPPRSMYVGVSTDAKQNLPVYTFTDHKIATGPAGSSAAQIFPYLTVDNFGHLFAAWSDNSNILYSTSSDQGTTWTAPVRVNQGATVGMANVFPTITAEANGHVAVAWFGADRDGNSNDATIMEPCPTGNTTCMTLWANWNVYVAETVNGSVATPAFVQSVASDHVIHRGTVSTGGLGGAANRNLGDFFQISFDPQHRLNLAFSDDHLLSPLDAAGTNPDDPTARRHIRAYFTRQTAPTAGIVTSGTCTASAPQTGNNISGSGQLGANVQFGISAHDQPLNGALHYSDSGANLDVKSSNGVTSVTFGGNCANVSGNAKVNGTTGYTYSYKACDNGTPGAGQDTFNISVSGNGFSYSQGGTLTGGNLTRP